jgi:carbon storage regulator
MLVLTRKIGESIVIGDDVVVTVRAMHGGRVRLSIEAPLDVTVLRDELIGERPAREEWDAPAEPACEETA